MSHTADKQRGSRPLRIIMAILILQGIAWPLAFHAHQSDQQRLANFDEDVQTITAWVRANGADLTKSPGDVQVSETPGLKVLNDKNATLKVKPRSDQSPFPIKGTLTATMTGLLQTRHESWGYAYVETVTTDGTPTIDGDYDGMHDTNRTALGTLIWPLLIVSALLLLYLPITAAICLYRRQRNRNLPAPRY